MLTIDAASLPPQIVDQEELRLRIRGEYEELPGMSLTLPQAARLFNVQPAECARALSALVADGTLWMNGREYVRRGGCRCN